VLGEVGVLRGQVVSLADQNQAFVFRIKQLEDYAQRQEQAVARLTQQLTDLQGSSNQSNGMSSAAGSGSGAGGAVRRSSEGGPPHGGAAVAGQAGASSGSFWSTQSAVL
jgi:hypothetical protein